LQLRLLTEKPPFSQNGIFPSVTFRISLRIHPFPPPSDKLTPSAAGREFPSVSSPPLRCFFGLFGLFPCASPPQKTECLLVRRDNRLSPYLFPPFPSLFRLYLILLNRSVLFPRQVFFSASFLIHCRSLPPPVSPFFFRADKFAWPPPKSRLASYAKSLNA